MPLQRKAVILPRRSGSPATTRPLAFESTGRGMMVLKQGGTETSPTAIRTREVFF